MKEKIMKIFENKKTRSDIILIAVLLVVGLSVLLAFYLGRTEGSVAVVSIDGVKVAEYPLSVDGVYYLNGGTNVLVIESGKAYIREANCPGYQDCVERGKISFVGESIICLPNKLEVKIVGEGDGIDI